VAWTPPKSAAHRIAGRGSAFAQGLLAGHVTVLVSGVRLAKFAGRALGRIVVDGQDLTAELITTGHG